MLRITSIAFSIALLLTQTGCARLGLPVIFEGRGGTITANKNQQERTNQELLLNIVRSRYQDPIEFSPKEPNRWSLFKRANRAALKEVAQLNQGYLDPIDIETLVMLLEADWEFGLVGDLLIDSIGNIENNPEASSYPQFIALVRHLELIQTRGDLGFIQLPPSWKIGEGREAPLVMKLSFADENEAIEFTKTAGIKGQLLADDDGRIVQLVLFVLPQEELSLRTQGAEIALIELRLRSLATQFNHFAQAIELPQRHIKRGLIQPMQAAKEAQFEPLHIMSHWHRMKHPYVAVRYRGYWFQIQDTDLRTKRAFALLKLLHQARYADQ